MFRKKMIDPLDVRLFGWSKADSLTVRDALNSLAIFGRTGSGKTSSSGKQLARAILSHPKSGGLILSAKPEDKDMWVQLFKNAGRADSLVVFAPGEDRRLNFLDYVRQMGGDTREITRCITTISETLRGGDNKGMGENSDYWEKEQARMIYNGVEILTQAVGKVTAPELQNFITTAPANVAQMQTPEWQQCFHAKTIRAAMKKPKTAIQQHDFDLAYTYWLDEVPQMADRTRSSISVGVFGTLHVFNTGIVRSLVSDQTNLTPDAIKQGKWVLVDMAPAEWGDSGAFVNSGWKYLAQRMILRRKAEPGDGPIVIWCDEAQQFLTSYDSAFLAQCRSHKGCMVFLTQSLHSYYAALGGQKGRHQADALLTNFGTKIAHALGDSATAEWIAGLVGKRLQTFMGSTSNPMQEDIWDRMTGLSRMSSSANEHMELVIQPRELMHGLRTGGTENNLICDAVVIRSGRPFSNGENHLCVAFSQE